MTRLRQRMPPRPTTVRYACATILLLALLPLAARAADPAPSLTPAEYRARLHSLDQLLAQCRRAPQPTNCPSSQVGPDIAITLPTGSRPVHFDWLRTLLDTAAKGEPSKSTPPKSTQPAPSVLPSDVQPPTLDQRLAAAQQRLAEEAQLAEQAEKPTSQSGTHSNSAAPRTQLDAILAAPAYHVAVAPRSISDRIREHIARWINKFLGRLIAAGAQSKWIGITAEIVFILLVCIALVWFLIRLEREGRFGPGLLVPGAGAASARDWHLWLADAQSAASRSAWRDAIHLLYWASISRLESTGLWPADRARTPREYLALLAASSPQHSGLADLTRSFERTWYANRPASQADFAQAQQLAAQLGIQPAIQPGAPTGSHPEVDTQ